MSAFYNFKVCVLSLIVFSTCLCCLAMDVSYDSRALTIDGDRKLIISGAIHYPRSTPQMWKDLIRKAKEGGLNTIETYVFWNAHEPTYRQYDFSGNLDLVRFIKTIQSEGLYVILRIGPYVCAEWNYGGLPVWLHNLKPGLMLRTTDPVFTSEMQTFTTLIVDTMKKESLFASQGGPIIVSQIENEYGNVERHYPDAKAYIAWCAHMAVGLNTGVPWLMCQQKDAPATVLSSCNGYYCDGYTPAASMPKLWTENWTGWFKGWGDKLPHRTAEDLAFSVARFFQLGGTLQNYYMYHGGTNFGRSAGGPFITTSYDYDAPIDEYGNLNQPKWGHLRDLHLVLRSLEKTLTYGSRRDLDNGVRWKSTTIYTYEGKEACFLANAKSDEDVTFDLYENTYTVPAWSVSILPDCYTEAYNTAKVNSQTSVMVKRDNEADDGEEPYRLRWAWAYEYMEHLHDGELKGGDLMALRLLDQKLVTNDTSDYLWYMTSIEVGEARKATLEAHTTGAVLHAFVNGRHVGSDYHINNAFTLKKHINLKKGKNSISLLSILDGLPNYGEYFDTKVMGIQTTNIQLVGKNATTLNLSSNNRWIYKIGMHGEKIKLFKDDRHTNMLWRTSNLPTNRKFVWYKTSFPTPLGEDPVAVDLMGMSKGVAWVNGHNIGRYWPAATAGENGCSYECDYRNTYYSAKCATNCGKPTQRWYHVPRSFLNDYGDNTLVLFEEMGGNPGLVRFQTVTVGEICAHAYENSRLELTCQGEQVVSEIKFASFGEPKGKCGSFRKGRCEAVQTRSVVEEKCVGQKSCVLDVNEATLGPTGCHGGTYRLAVEATCGPQF